MSDKTLRTSGWIKIWLVVVIVAAAAWFGVQWLGTEAEAGSASFQTAEVDRGTIRQTVIATGRLNPVLSVEVGSQVSGNIKELLVDFNSPVEAGQVIARLDPSTFEANLREAEAELASAEAALELAQVSADRMRRLAERELVPRSEVDQAVAGLQQAKATLRIREHSLERARTELMRCTIYSPIDGIVISRNVDVGQTVAASMTAPILFEIANDLSEMQINSNIAEADIGRIEPGQRVEFTVDAFSDESFMGEVVQVRNAPIIENNVVTYDTVISVENPRGKLKPGMTANVSVVVDEVSEVLRVRNAAFRSRLPDSVRPADPSEVPEGARLAYRLPANNQGGLEAVAVTTGITDGVYTEIVNGLEEGERVATGMALQTGRGNGEGDRPSIFGPSPAQY